MLNQTVKHALTIKSTKVLDAILSVDFPMYEANEQGQSILIEIIKHDDSTEEIEREIYKLLLQQNAHENGNMDSAALPKFGFKRHVHKS